MILKEIFWEMDYGRGEAEVSIVGGEGYELSKGKKEFYFFFK